MRERGGWESVKGWCMPVQVDDGACHYDCSPPPALSAWYPPRACPCAASLAAERAFMTPRGVKTRGS